MLHLKISSERRVPLGSLLLSSSMILMKGRIRVNAAFELNIVLQNELNMTRWDAKNRRKLGSGLFCYRTGTIRVAIAAI